MAKNSSNTPAFRFFSRLPLLLACCLAVPLLVCAYSLSPRGTKYEQHVAKQYSDWFQRTVVMLGRRGALHFSEAVHEEITQRIFGCGDADFCNDPDVEFAGPFVLAGVRWNDDPPFRLGVGEGQHTSCNTAETIRFTTQPLCWYQLFKSAKRQAESGDVPSAYNHAPLLSRSHFGDLQFLHANQDEHKHAHYDTREAFQAAMAADNPNAVAVGQPLRDFYEHEAKWETVRPYFECIFSVVDPNAKASPGNGFTAE